MAQVKYFNMDKEKLNNVILNHKNKSNKDLFECRDMLSLEFDNTKNLIIELTRHLTIIEENYNIINNEIGERLK